MTNNYSTDEFEAAYTYRGNDLGAAWSEESTTFKVWAPTAESMSVKLYEGGDASVSDMISESEMALTENGVWTLTLDGDIQGKYYTYEVTIDGVSKEANDPYARTAGVNGKRAMVIDLSSTDPDGWENDRNPHEGESINDAIIYEAHIRDLTSEEGAGITNVGKYLGIVEEGTKTDAGISTGLDHIKDLGITHLHILPFYDFGSVDEADSADSYNWGYDPMNYNVPEGSYSTDPYDGSVRVKEVKQMVKNLHDNGISVVMDVVYNHVYDADSFCFNVLVPGYFSRISEEGVYSNGSGCGNDTASERAMVRKYIVDSVCYWAEEYHIDGFRFDLVGLLDVDTINEIVTEVKKINPDIIFYGEGWSLSTTPTKEGTVLATQANSSLTPSFAYFNDTMRNAIKGSVFDTKKGFVQGAAGYEAKISRCFKGLDSWCQSPSQTINYASCHDNNTLYDRIMLSLASDTPYEDVVSMNKLSGAICMTSEGVPFMQAGEEMLRSKVNADGTFNENSFNAGDAVNAIKYSSLEDESAADVYNYYKGLISFRKAHKALRLSTAEDVNKYVTEIKMLKSKCTAYLIDGSVEGETSDGIIVIFNARDESVSLDLPEGEWGVCVDKETAGTDILRTLTGTVSIEPISAMVLVKENASKPFLPAIIGAGVALFAAVTVIFRKRKRK